MRALILLVVGIVLRWKRIERRGLSLLFTARLRCSCCVLAVCLPCKSLGSCAALSRPILQQYRKAGSLQLATKES